MVNLLRYPDALKFRDQHEIWDDFTDDTVAEHWVKTGDASSTFAVGDAVGGIMTVTPGSATDEDECYVESPNETFKIATGKPLVFEALVQFTEAVAGTANVIAGIMSAVGADTLVDAGAGPKTTFDGAVIYKVDGGTVWRCRSSVGATNTDSVSTTTAGGAAYQRLRIEWHDYTATQAQITFEVDGVRLVDSRGLPIVHTVLFASATEMQLALGVKNGTTTQESLLVDYVYGGQVR